MIKLTAMPCICYELEISRDKLFIHGLSPTHKIFNLENVGLDSIIYVAIFYQKIQYYMFVMLKKG